MQLKKASPGIQFEKLLLSCMKYNCIKNAITAIKNNATIIIKYVDGGTVSWFAEFKTNPPLQVIITPNLSSRPKTTTVIILEYSLFITSAILYAICRLYAINNLLCQCRLTRFGDV